MFLFLVIPHFDCGQIKTLLVNAFLGLVRHALPIGKAVNQDGVECHQDELTDQNTGPKTLHTLFLLECKGDAYRNGNEVVAR